MSCPPIEADEMPDGPYRFDRRSSERHPVDGAATALRIAGEHFGRIHDLALIDYSHGGMAATSSEPIEPGALISIGFQPDGLTARRGTVLRCFPCGDGYHLAVRFEQRLAA